MKKVLDWMKSNPLIVACLVIGVLAIAGGYFYGSMKTGELFEKMDSRKAIINQARGLMYKDVKLPPKEAGGEERSKRITVNEVAIKRYNAFSNDLLSQLNDISEQLVEENQAGHVPMKKDLFPDVTGAEEEVAKERYRELLNELLAELNPGIRMTKEELMEALTAPQKKFLREIPQVPVDAVAKLNAGDRKKLNKALQNKAFEILRGHAEKMSLYVRTTNLDDQGGNHPFPVKAEAIGRGAMSDMDFWHIQMQLWILQDIVAAVKKVNTGHVVDNPIKELSWVAFPSVWGGYFGTSTSVKAAGEKTQSYVPEVPKGAPAPIDYRASPTGRISNSNIYEIHHAMVNVLVRKADIPKVIDAFSSVNHMSVIKTTVSDINEYNLLHNPSGIYYFGEGQDVCELVLTIETIWFHEWMKDLRPKEEQG